MKIAIDTSVLFSILKSETDGKAWLEALIRERKSGASLVFCSVVYAELAPVMPDQATLMQTLEGLGITNEHLTEAAAWKAGETLRVYRENGGPRTHLVPDFLIASHALVQCDALAALDRGYLRTYFPKVKLLRK